MWFLECQFRKTPAAIFETISLLLALNIPEGILRGFGEPLGVTNVIPSEVAPGSLCLWPVA